MKTTPELEAEIVRLHMPSTGRSDDRDAARHAPRRGARVPGLSTARPPPAAAQTLLEHQVDRLGDRSGKESCEARAAMQFAKQLRDRVRRGEITCSVRIWMRLHVKAGGRYSLPPGEIEVDAVIPIRLADLTPALARKSGFRDVDDLLATAKHGRGESVFLVHFHYVPPKRRRSH